MAQSYKTVEGDRIDLIVRKHYGDGKMLPHVLAENPHLPKMAMILESGINITLPEVVTVQESETVTEKQEKGSLW